MIARISVGQGLRPRRGSRRRPAGRSDGRRVVRASPTRRRGSAPPPHRSPQPLRERLAQEAVGLLRRLRGGRLAGADRPDRLVGDGERSGPPARAAQRAGAPSTSKVRARLALLPRLADADHAASGRRRAAAATLRPPPARRSRHGRAAARCGRRAPRCSRRRRAGGPRRRRCAPLCPRGGGPARRPRSRCPPARAATTGISGKEGKTTRLDVRQRRGERPAADRGSTRPRRPRSRFIFQFAAISGRRRSARAHRRLLQDGHAGQGLAGEELERRAAAGRDVADAGRPPRPA